MKYAIDNLIASLEARGLSISLDDSGRVQYAAPEFLVTTSLFNQLIARKDEAVSFLAHHGPHRKYPPIRKARHADEIPCSFNQEECLDEAFDPAPVVQDRMVVSQQIRGAMDPATIVAAVKFAVERHETLRVSFARSGDGWLQRVHGAEICHIEFLDLAQKPEEGQKAIESLVASLKNERIDPGSPPLFRAYILRTDPLRSVLVMAAYRAVMDAPSWNILLRDITLSYDFMSNDMPPDLPDLGVRYRDFSVWQRQHCVASDAYWAPSLADAPALGFGPAPSSTSLRELKQHRLGFRCARPQAFAQFCAAHRITPPILVTGILGALLCRRAGHERGAFGLVSNGRPTGVENLVGAFAQIRPFVADTTDNPDLKEFAYRVRRAFLATHDWQRRASRPLLKKAGVSRTRINVMSGGKPGVAEGFSPDGESNALTISPMATETEEAPRSHCELVIRIAASSAGASGTMAYAADEGSSTSIDVDANEFAHEFSELLPQWLATPTKRLSDMLPATNAR